VIEISDKGAEDSEEYGEDLPRMKMANVGHVAAYPPGRAVLLTKYCLSS
jgi:hypothetical protein